MDMLAKPLSKKQLSTFRREFFIISGKKETMCKAIFFGCAILSALHEKHILHVIEHILLYLNWTEFARCAEVVNFDLFALIIKNQKLLRRIFVVNTYFGPIHSDKLFQLDYHYLSKLDAKALHIEYHRVSRFPSVNIFDCLKNKVTGVYTYGPPTESQYHPNLPLLAIIYGNADLYILAYESKSLLRSKCINNGLLFHYSAKENNFYSIHNFQWSPTGIFFSFFAETSAIQQYSDWHPRTNLSSPICSHPLAIKNIIIHHLNDTSGHVRYCGFVKCCKWKQSKYIWSSHSTFTYYFQKNIYKTSLCTEKKKFETTLLCPNFYSIYCDTINNQKKEFTGLMVHPQYGNQIFFVVPCLDSRVIHYHHQLVIFDLHVLRITACLSIAGVISNILFDCCKPQIVIRYLYYAHHQYQSRMSASKQTNPTSCDLENPVGISDATLQHVYAYDRREGRNYLTKRLQQFEDINLPDLQRKIILPFG